MVEITLQIPLEELCETQGVDKDLIVEVVEYGIATPIGGVSLTQWSFDLESAHWIKKAIKLNQQLLLDWVAISLVIDLMKEKEKLEQENSLLKTRLSRII